jgi:DNA repair protein RadC
VEYFYILLLNRANQVLGVTRSKGGFTGTVIDVRVVFRWPQACATSIFAVHNHPSGNLTPSDAVGVITNKISEAGKLLESSCWTT